MFVGDALLSFMLFKASLFHQYNLLVNNMLRFLPLICCIFIFLGLGYWITSDQADQSQIQASTISVNSLESQKKTSLELFNSIQIDENEPIAVVDDDSYDFGVVERFTHSEHYFTVRNEGTAPLELTKGPSSCSCTVLGLTNQVVAPGEEVAIKLSWNTRLKEGLFDQKAIIYTNDPEHKELVFQVKGLVEKRFGVSRENVIFSSIIPGKQASQDILVFSKTSSSLSGLTFQATGVGPEIDHKWIEVSKAELKELNVRSAMKLRITVLPTDVEQIFLKQCVIFGSISESINEDRVEKVSLERIDLTVQGSIKGGFKILSPLIDRSGVIHIGRIEHGQGKTVRLSLKIRDSELDFNTTEIKTYPDFVQAKLVPFGTEKPGLYFIEIDISKDAPKCIYHGDHGYVLIASDHPRIPKIKTLWLRFRVE
ncbi:MAG: hypothetical protein COA78_21820 [Blastopirellula sp.]|nr:MAG: hypothetical protein COA78_21820 [Blastopirellula sp.]